MSDEDLRRLLGDDYLAGVEDLDAPALRAKRDECELAEHRISYARRILQGRVDVLRAEAAERSDGTTRGVLERLPDVLADQGERQFDPARTRPPSTLDPDELGDAADVAGPVDVAGLDDAELADLADQYAQEEARLSRTRRQLFDVIDRLQAELADRYRTGRASITDLFESS